MFYYIGCDPSTKTGFVVLNEAGNVILTKEIRGIGSVDPKRMATMIDDIMDHIGSYRQRGKVFIAIEGLPFESPQAIQMGGIGWGLRMMFYNHGYEYVEVAPMALKSFVGATGFTADKDPVTGRKRRLKGKEAKEQVKECIEQKYGYSFDNDNINDAFVLAKIAMLEHKKRRLAQ